MIAQQLHNHLFATEQPFIQSSESHKPSNSVHPSDTTMIQPSSSSITMKVKDSNQSINEQQQPHCMPALYGEEQIPILQCMGADYRILVFPKIASNTELSTVQMPTSTSGITGDTYPQSSCCSVEFYGQPSVYCEGEEQTTAVYTPALHQRPLENLGENIMLAAVAMKLTSNFFGWIKEKIIGESGEIPVKQSMVSAEYFKSQAEKYSQQLNRIENKIKACQNKNNQIDLYWAEFALEEYRYDIDDLETKGRATKEELKKLRDGIPYFEKELNEELKMTDRVVSAELLEPVISHCAQSFFYADRTTASHHSCHAMPVKAGNSTANASDGNQGLHYVPKFRR